jgi:hypothetical protein
MCGLKLELNTRIERVFSEYKTEVIAFILVQRKIGAISGLKLKSAKCAKLFTNMNSRLRRILPHQ